MPNACQQCAFFPKVLIMGPQVNKTFPFNTSYQITVLRGISVVQQEELYLTKKQRLQSQPLFHLEIFC